MKSGLLLAIVSMVVFLVPSVGGGQCEFDCYEILVMAGVNNGDPYCYKFAEDTGRLLWSDTGEGLGGSPVSKDCIDDTTEQVAEKRANCQARCALNEIPQEPATEGTYVGPLTWGCYYCSG